MNLTEIIAKLEKAEGPSREVDAEIAECLGIAVEPEVGCFLPMFTSSIDHALMLVPEGRPYSVGGPIILRHREKPPYFHGSVDRPYPYDPSPAPMADGADAPTASLALCIAALKARLYTRPK